MKLSMRLMGIVHERVQDLGNSSDIDKYKTALAELTEEDLIKLIAVGIIQLHDLYDRLIPVKLGKQ
jgi:hypothetical protein